MTCKECVHYEVCAYLHDTESVDFAKTKPLHCDHFKPKSRFVELPCEAGQTIYRVGKGKVWEWQIAVIEVYQDEIALVDDSDNYIKPEDIGKTVFFSREEAEKVLAERSK